MNTEEEHYYFTSKLNVYIRFSMMFFIGLNILVSIATFVVQFKVDHDPIYIKESISDLGFNNLE